MKKSMPVGVWMVLILAWLVACTPATEMPAEEPEAGLPNPASVYCEEQGGRLEMRDDENGTSGICILPDGNECEEWAFYRQECAPGNAAEAPNPVAARDAVLDYLLAMEMDIPGREANWQQENLTAEGLVGGSQFRYSVQDWTVTVAFPVVAPQATNYTVKVSQQSSGFSWQGSVDADGRVNEAGQENGQADVGLANPAAVNCQEQGGRLEMRSDDAGTHSVCLFEDGGECDQWAYWRGECGPASSETKINVAMEAGLTGAVKLDLLALDTSAEGKEPYELVISIENPFQIEDMVRSLNTATPRTPKTFCMPAVILRFQLPDNSVQEFGYLCDPANPRLSGTQSLWQNQEAIAPPLFVALVDSYLGQEQPPAATGGSLNPVAIGNLAVVTRIEVLQQTVTESNRISQATIEPLLDIVDAQTIASIIKLLDVDLTLTPRARCLANLVLVFHRADDSSYTLSYGCDLETATFLRGDQDEWQGQDVIAPAELQQLILAATGE